jgi:hypothetical protein
MGVVSGPRLVVDVMITVGRQAVVEDIGSSRREPRWVAVVLFN